MTQQLGIETRPEKIGYTICHNSARDFGPGS